MNQFRSPRAGLPIRPNSPTGTAKADRFHVSFSERELFDLVAEKLGRSPDLFLSKVFVDEEGSYHFVGIKHEVFPL